jgi:SEC-C motif-containing protein
MRSRYSAFVLGLGEYLVNTLTRPPRLAEASELGKWGRSVGWVGLTVHSSERGGVSDVDGTVHFTARYVEKSALVSLSEKSAFTRVDGQWRYVEGEATTTSEKLGRNDPCPCGRGKKVKQCHG